MSTPNYHDMSDLDERLDLLRQAQKQATDRTGQGNVKRHILDVRSDAAERLHRAGLQNKTAELSPQVAKATLAAVHNNDDEASALKALGKQLAGGPAGDIVRAWYSAPGPLGRTLPKDLQRQLDDLMDDVADGTEQMGSDAKGGGGTSTGRQSDGGVQAKKGSVPERDLHTGPAPARGKRSNPFADASKATRARMDEAFKSDRS